VQVESGVECPGEYLIATFLDHVVEGDFIKGRNVSDVRELAYAARAVASQRDRYHCVHSYSRSDTDRSLSRPRATCRLRTSSQLTAR